jgi:hypothetical protein
MTSWSALFDFRRSWNPHYSVTHSGYEHPDTVVYAPAVSCESCHPFPTTTPVAIAACRRVTGEPVGVNVGKTAICWAVNDGDGPIDAGGKDPYEDT